MLMVYIIWEIAMEVLINHNKSVIGTPQCQILHHIFYSADVATLLGRYAFFVLSAIFNKILEYLAIAA